MFVPGSVPPIGGILYLLYRVDQHSEFEFLSGGSREGIPRF